MWWALRGQDADTGPQPWDAEPLSSYAPGTAPEPLWQQPNAAHAKAPAPLPAGDLVIVAAPDGVLRAYRVTDGKRRWDSPPAATAAGALRAPDGSVLTVGAKGAVFAIGAADGKQIWLAGSAEAALLLAVDDTAVYVLTHDNRIRAVDLVAHKIRWTGARSGECRRTPAATTRRVRSEGRRHPGSEGRSRRGAPRPARCGRPGGSPGDGQGGGRHGA
ncbi:PQQ-binding-like beta-propeller repeat protein [Streptomyces violens]|uniref:outer membrane protein assembly factor BamB family protein n=1 Tax=Streptomyces violens TaxID=66377 RepID=UPI000A8D8007|nr:PQQ-binding-like beta-propeller repeat protein [Streptomyces violens]